MGGSKDRRDAVTAHEVCKRALEHFGPVPQKIKALEELSELQTVIAKDLNQLRVTQEEVIDEIADAWIMVRQMAILYGEKAVAGRMEEKIKRLGTMAGCNEGASHCPACGGCICNGCAHDNYDEGDDDDIQACCFMHRDGKTCAEWRSENKCPGYAAEGLEG